MIKLLTMNKAHLSGIAMTFSEWMGGGISTFTGMPEEIAAGLSGAVGWLLVYWVPNFFKPTQ